MDNNTGPRSSDRGVGGSPDKIGVYDRDNAPGKGAATTGTGGSAMRWIIAAVVVVLLILALLYIL